MVKVINGGKRNVCFVCWNCHFIFRLLSVGNMVSEVE